ncbi:MAG: sigma-70 family RNA polymerase sigma factor [Paracoccaceae bacterium]|nr:MAG: sigma-70 family RNA polymerase sigma factor [Paracoccaceae bacterium]
MTGDPFEDRLAPLWAAARGGDAAAYRTALALIAGRLRAYYGRRLAGQPDETEDLVQETLLAIHLKRDTHDPNLPVSNWLHAIARYRLTDHWRRQGRRGTVELDDSLHEAPETSEGVQAAVARRDLGVLLRTLPDAQREAIELVKVEGYSTEEAAARMGITVTTLKVRVHRGLQRLMARAGGGGA